MERNDILNTNLLQLPMKAQAADEGAVQEYRARCSARRPRRGSSGA